MAQYYFLVLFYILLLTGCINSKGDDSTSESNEIATDYDCTTKVMMRSFTLKWTIPNYELASRTNTLLTSPAFPLEGNDTRKWRVEFEPLMISKGSTRKLKFYLRKNDPEETFIMTDLIIETPIGNYYKIENLGGLTYDRARWALPTVSVDILHRELKWGETYEKTLIITCPLQVFNSVEHTCRKVPNKLFESEIWSQDIAKFFSNDKTLQDYTIFVQGKEFHAHKAILAARSEFFAEMFSTKENEQISNSSMEIKDTHPETIEKMLHFLYTDEVKNMTVDNVVDLLEVADQYSILGLKNVALIFAVSHRTLIRDMGKFRTLIAKRPNILIEFIDLQDYVPEIVDHRAPVPDIDPHNIVFPE